MVIYEYSTYIIGRQGYNSAVYSTTDTHGTEYASTQTCADTYSNTILPTGASGIAKLT